MTKMNKIGRVVIPMTLALAPFLVLAALPTPTSPYTGGEVTLAEIERLIQRIAQFLIISGVIIAVIFIIWGGITYMMAGGDSTKAGEAKTRIINGVIGAAVVLGVGVILSTLASLIARSFFT